VSAPANALRAPASTTALLKYDIACRAVAEAKTLDDVRDWEDKAAAVREYTRRVGNRSLELDAIEIREGARRRRGELLLALKSEGRLRDGKPSSAEDRLTLDELGVSRNESYRDQTIATLAPDSFERLITRCRAYAEEHPEKHTFDMLTAERKETRHVANSAAYAERVYAGCTVEDLNRLAADGCRFSCIYADPPYEFNAYSAKGKDRSADRHYDTRGLDAIMALKVGGLAADDCVLLMWAVMPTLPGALEVIKAWGFTFKTVGFTWVKQNKNSDSLFCGMGYWTRANAELCLLATKGNPKRLNADVQQVLIAPVMEHSRKPDEFHNRIERLVGGPYLELYARRERPGWTVWGNEIPREKLLPPHDPQIGEIIETPAPVLLAPRVAESSDDLSLPTFLRRDHPDCTWR
jgi:N6-adenosine-specific RNA methylase IME4